MLFNVDAAGKLTLDNASVNISISPTLAVGAFKPGTYNGYSAGLTYARKSTTS